MSEDNMGSTGDGASGDAGPTHPWNWCPTCAQAIDIDDETHEGNEVRCWGCRAWYVVTHDGERFGLASCAEVESETAHEPANPEASVHREVVRNVRAFALRRVEPTPAASESADESLSNYFHRCWTSCVGSPKYDKSAWKSLVRAVESAEASGESSAIVASMAAISDLRVAQMGERVDELPRPLDDTAEIVSNVAARMIGCAAGCGSEARKPLPHLVATGAAGCAPLCIRCYTVAVREDERRRATATPTGHAVAALLARVKRAWDGAKNESETHPNRERATYCDGTAHGLKEAHRMIREVLGTTSPLDEVVAEVLALSPDDDSAFAPEHSSTAYNEIRSLCVDLPDDGDGADDAAAARRDLLRIARVAIAGALTFAPAPTGPRCRHCRAALGAEHKATCCMRHEPWAKEATETIVSAAACGEKGGA